MSRILVADDEPLLRQLNRAILEDAGHKVDEASDGLEAQEMLLRERYDVVVTDHVMPGVRGRDLVRWIRAHPNLEIAKAQVILVTGGSEDLNEVVAEIGATPNAEMLLKPYMAKHLLEKLNTKAGA